MDLNGAESFTATAVGHFLANEMHVPECSCPFRCMNLNAISFGAKGSMYLNAISFDAKEMGAQSRNSLLDTEKNRPLHSCQSKQTHP